jgi:hypothetical protein
MVRITPPKELKSKIIQHLQSPPGY